MGQRRGTAVLLVLLVALGKAATPGGWWGGCPGWGAGAGAGEVLPGLGLGALGRGRVPCWCVGDAGGGPLPLLRVVALWLFSGGSSLAAPPCSCPQFEQGREAPRLPPTSSL